MNIFGNQNQGASNNPFMGSTGNKPNNLFGGQGNTQQGANQQSNNLFGNQGGTGTGLFNNLAGNRPNQPNNNIFGNNQGNQQQPQQNNIFGNQQQGNQQQGQQGNNLFNQGNAQGNIFQNTQGNQGNQLFNQNQNTQGNNMFNNQTQNQGNMLNNQPYYPGMAPNRTTPNPEEVKNQISTLLSFLNPKNLDMIYLDQNNKFRYEKINSIPQFKQHIVQLMSNFKKLKEQTNKLKQNNNALEEEATRYSKSVFEKLQVYKQCLIQNLSQMTLIDEVKKELDTMDRQINEFFKPLYNAYQSKKPYTFLDPDQFCIDISQEILKKLNILNNKIDDILACQEADQSDEPFDTVDVLEQLIEYYQNVSAKMREFAIKYNAIKKKAIEKSKKGNYDDIMRRISEKVNANVAKQFKSYDLIKEIDTILAKREKKSEEPQNKEFKF